MALRPLFPDVLDSRFQFSWKPESIIQTPLKYRFLIRDVDTGLLVTPDDATQHWREYGQTTESPLTPNDELTTTIDIPLLLERANKNGGTFLLMAYVYDSNAGILLEREQSQYLVIIENGLKPPSLH